MQIRLTTDCSSREKDVLSVGTKPKTENHIDIANSACGGHINILTSDGTKIDCHFKGNTDLVLDFSNSPGKFESITLDNTNQTGPIQQNPQGESARPDMPAVYMQPPAVPNMPAPAVGPDIPAHYGQQPAAMMENGYEMWQNQAAYQNGTVTPGSWPSFQNASIPDIPEFNQGDKGKGSFSADKPRKKEGKLRKFISATLFYGLLICLIGGAFLISQGSKKSVFGYYFMNVLTWSMQSEIPQGSMVVVRQVDPSTIKIGDDITYMKDTETSVTHRVIGITENFEGSGQKGFETQGIENDTPDFEMVPAVNVMGVVKFHVPMLGSWLEWLREHLVISIIFTAGFILLIVLLKGAFKKDPEKDKRHPSPSG